MNKKCKNCDSLIVKKKSEGVPYFSKKKYCSRGCAAKYQVGAPRKGKMKRCSICKKSFYVKRVHLGFIKNCSRICHGKWISKIRVGSNAANWKGGIRKEKSGYIYIYKPEHPASNSQGYVFEHRLIMEKKIGRLLTKKEVIHHIDENPSNNLISNLMLFKNNGEHRKYHAKK